MKRTDYLANASGSDSRRCLSKYPPDQVSSTRRKPSQVANPFATASIWSGLTTPSLRIAEVFGYVDTPCTRKAPGRRNGTLTEISNRLWRTAVVWGTTVTMARSESP